MPSPQCREVGVVNVTGTVHILVVDSVGHCKQPYPLLQLLFEFASLCFSLFIAYCFFDILYNSLY